MKEMRNLRMVVLGLVVLGWATACAGTGEMMDKEDTMAKDTKMGMDKSMSDDSMMDKNKGMDKTMSNDGMMDKNKDMEKKIHGTLMGSDGHHAAGKISFGMGMNNAHVLTLSDIKVDKVPDGYVYLARDGDWMHGVEVGMLKQFSGTVSFDLPDGVNPEEFDTVVIWCKKFNVEIGRAAFGKKMM
jgi:hypothetical protein